MNKNKILLLILAALIIIFAAIFILRDTSVPVSIPKNEIIVAFGDSLVQGVGATEGNDFVSVAARLSGMPIVNEGKSGDTTESARARVDDVIAHDPGLVIVLLGGNDYLRRVPKETTFKNLGIIVDAFKEKGIAVLLLGVRGGLLRDTYEGDFSAFAKKEGVSYIPNVLNGLIGHQEFMSDEIHPNDKGYLIIGRSVADKLKEIYKK